MTSLQLAILRALSQHGPMSDAKLLGHTNSTAMTAVVLACFELQKQEYIDLPVGTRPVSYDWRLTEKGMQYVNGLGKTLQNAAACNANRR